MARIDDLLNLSVSETESSIDGRGSSQSLVVNGTEVVLDEPMEPYVRKRSRNDDGESRRKKVRELPEPEALVSRLKINSRERRRMHDLNQGYEELRAVMPGVDGARARKQSKIATLMLAKHYILVLSSSVAQLKHQLQEATAHHDALASPKASPPLPKGSGADFSTARLLREEEGRKPALPFPPPHFPFHPTHLVCIKTLPGGAGAPCLCFKCQAGGVEAFPFHPQHLAFLPK